MEIKANHKIILVDFFGVVCSEIAPFWFERYFPADMAAELKHTYLRPADTGEVSPEALFQTLADLVQTTSAQVEEEWISLVKINEEVVSLIRLAKTKFRVVLCSNAMSTFIRRILKENELEDLFDAVVISSEIGAAKPDPNFFTKILEILQVTSKEVFFIDDNPKILLQLRN